MNSLFDVVSAQVVEAGGYSRVWAAEEGALALHLCRQRGIFAVNDVTIQVMTMAILTSEMCPTRCVAICVYGRPSVAVARRQRCAIFSKVR